jgi:hypothetical protein
VKFKKKLLFIAVRLEIFAVMKVQVMVFRVMMPCSNVVRCQFFARAILLPSSE